MTYIIFVNRYFYPDTSATSQMLSDLAFALAASGRSISIITSRQLYDDASIRLADAERSKGVDIHRVWTSRFGRANLIGRTIDYATFYIFAGWKLLQLAGHGDVVVAKTDPPLLSVIVAPIALLNRAKLVNWLQDLFPEIAEQISKPNCMVAPVFAFLRMLRNGSLRSACANVVIGQRMATKVSSLGVPNDKIHVIANWADGEQIKPLPRSENKLREAWGVNHRFVVGYSGNLGRAHEVGTMLSAMSALAKIPGGGDRSRSTSDIVWLFIGGGALFSPLKAGIEKRGLRSAIFKPYQPLERLAESLSAADVHLVSLLGVLEGFVVPSKIYGIAAAGRPAINIGHHDGEVAQLLKRHDFGFTVAPGDGAGLAMAIRQLADDAELRQRLGENARAAFEAEFDKLRAASTWQALLEDVGSQSRP
ncbi:MAG: glycosyltransferase family 4 protein [Hyphomicrobium sp.]